VELGGTWNGSHWSEQAEVLRPKGQGFEEFPKCMSKSPRGMLMGLEVEAALE